MAASDRAQNAAFLCLHFARNFAYYGAGQKLHGHTSDPFWLAVIGNFVDIAILEWCKLFGNRNGKYHWRKVLKDPDAFVSSMPERLGISGNDFDALHSSVKTYRDEFIAHLEDSETTLVPNMNLPYVLAWSYYMQLREDYPSLKGVAELPRDFGNYWRRHSEQGLAVFKTVVPQVSQ